MTFPFSLLDAAVSLESSVISESRDAESKRLLLKLWMLCLGEVTLRSSFVGGKAAVTAARQFRLAKRHTTDFFRRLQLGLKLVLLLSRGGSLFI